jgi:arginase
MHSNVEIISAPSILGLKPNGVENLAESLLQAGLAVKLQAPVRHIPTLNAAYSNKRDPETNCLNPSLLVDFSKTLNKVILDVADFALVLGGDCSILLGIMPALKLKGNYGLIFIDAHADFYEPEKSITGEVADMDLAIITGRGPAMLTDMNGLRPYVKDEHVIHIGQRDQEETIKYGSQEIRETAISCYSLADIKRKGLNNILAEVLEYIDGLRLDGYWIHFDTDVLADAINPAVEYRLPHGLSFRQVEKIVNRLLSAQEITGMSVTVFNPLMDKDGSIAKGITACIAKSLERLVG